MVLSAQSQNITVYSDITSLNELVKCVERSPKIMTLDSPISAVSNCNKSNGQIIILSSLNTLWLIDFSDFLTIKILSYHHKPIAAMKISSTNPGRLLTGGADGVLRETRFDNLEQEK